MPMLFADASTDPSADAAQQPHREIAAASLDIGRHYAFPSWKGHVQTDHPDKDEGDEPHAQEQ